tara:strand:- start:495 stop:995 length:501 start_codon:yes stop_codon:yes gene_type:complete
MIIRRIYILTIIVLLYSCGSGPAVENVPNGKNTFKEDNSIEDNFSNNEDLKFGTRIYGEVLDTSYIALEDVRISTAPATIEIISNENGFFELVSQDFISEIAYDIIFMHRDYKTETINGYYPNIDEGNEMDLILMTPLPLEDNGSGPGEATPPPTPPMLPPGSGRE